MPRCEPKIIQKELQQGLLWPVYWLYGPERMKARELLKHIRKAALGPELSAFGEEMLDGSECDGMTVVDAAKSLSLGGGLRFIVIKEAHLLKNPDTLAELVGPARKKEDAKDPLTSVCVFLSKELDGRRKISKILTEKAAVVPCDEVTEGEREAWVHYLAKRRGITLPVPLGVQLCSVDPWSLDSVDQELEKFELTQSGDALLGGGGSGAIGSGDGFLHAFFTRDLKQTLLEIETFAEQPEEAFKLLGLFAWNVRNFALFIKDQGRNTKLNPYVLDRFRTWSALWKLEELLELQSALSELDFDLKQTPLLPLGGWSGLAMRFCKAQ